jgi:hypothetical protein
MDATAGPDGGKNGLGIWELSKRRSGGAIDNVISYFAIAGWGLEGPILGDAWKMKRSQLKVR